MKGKQRRRKVARHTVTLGELRMSALELVTHFPDATYNASRGAYRIGGTLVLVPSFRLSDADLDDASATGDLWA